MQTRWHKLIGAPLVAGAAFLTACSDSTGAGRGTLSLAITDAPFPYAEVDSAIVHVVRIDAKREDATEAQADAGATETRTDGEQDTSGWVTLATPDQAINLLDLQNGKTMNLGQETLPTGSYRGFRLVIDPALSRVVLKSGARADIKWPSAARSGIKVKLAQPIGVTTGETLMVIDFDLAGSFVMRGNSIAQNGLLFKPVVRATARDVAGFVGGTVRAGTATGTPVAAAQVELWKALADTATAGSAPLATAGTDAAGTYKIVALLPGSYALRVLPPAGSTNAQAVVESVTVVTGTNVATDVVLP
jgi:hypothetical protein